MNISKTVFATSEGRDMGWRYTDTVAAPGSLLALDASDVVYRVVSSHTLEARGGGDDNQAGESKNREGHRAIVEPLSAGDREGGTRDRIAGPPRARTQVVSSSNGVGVTLYELGGSGPPLLICHATGFNGMAYAPMAAGLTDDFTVWALDFRGHGATSSPVSGEFGWNGMADDILACVDAIGVSSLVAFGHSMGGAAILLAELARPGIIEGAYLFEPVVFPPETRAEGGVSPLSVAARKRRPSFESKRSAYERYASRLPLSDLRPDALAAYVEHGFIEKDGEAQLACEPDAEARTFEAAGLIEIDSLESIKSRTTVARGVVSPESPAAIAPLVVDAIEGAVLSVHEDLGHFGPLQDPDRIADDVRSRLVN